MRPWQYTDKAATILGGLPYEMIPALCQWRWQEKAHDCVAKLFLGMRAKFSRGAGALILKSCGGHMTDPIFNRQPS
jgi:hypothetical protein